MSKVTEVIWINTTSGTIGIVLSDNGFEKKASIKQVSGFDEDRDTKDVLANGVKFHLQQAESIVEHLKSVGKKEKDLKN